MRYRIVFFLILLSQPLHLSAQTIAPRIEWSHCFGGSDEDQALSVEQTSDNGYIIAGLSRSSDSNLTLHHGTADATDAWVIRLDSTGKLLWQSDFGGDEDDIANSIQQTPDGGFIFAGTTSSLNGDVITNHGGKDYWVVKLNEFGKLKWQKTFGGSNDDEATSIAVVAGGGFIVNGFSYSNDGDVRNHHGDNSRADLWVVRIDDAGNLLWQKSYGGSKRDYGYSIAQSQNNHFLLGGYSNSSDGDIATNHGDDDFLAIEIDSVGKIVWEKTYGGSGIDEAYSIAPTQDDGCIVAGFTFSTDGDVGTRSTPANPDDWIVKLDKNGKIEWKKILGGEDLDAIYSVEQTLDGGFVALGSTSSTTGSFSSNHGESDFYFLRLDPSGNLLWQMLLGGSGNEFGLCVALCSDSGFVLAGTADSDDGDVHDHQFKEDFWVAKLGYSKPSSVHDFVFSRLRSSAFPNPFKTETKIMFKGNIESPSELILYNLLGQEVKKLVVLAGAQEVSIYRNALSSGMYVYRLVEGGLIRASGNLIIE
ncbi:MAG: T9SS type A sorting domain-containing protein [bacterium]